MAKSTNPAGPASAASPTLAIPDFEVKLFLDAGKVLDVEFKPTEKACGVLALKDSNRKISMQFLDARPFAIHAEGWGVRVRKFEDEDRLELSYKRRFPVGGGTIADALAAAANEGFDAGEDDYAAQVEWGFGKRTVSFTRKKDFSSGVKRGMNLPGAEEVRRAAVDLLPGKLVRWKQEGWARGVLAGGHLYGPVLGKRWTGSWDGPELAFEVWFIKTESGQGYEPVVELSFKAEKEGEASSARDRLLSLARQHDMLLERDVLKTEMILTRY